jgi:hypothetical protein
MDAGHLTTNEHDIVMHLLIPHVKKRWSPAPSLLECLDPGLAGNGASN